MVSVTFDVILGLALLLSAWLTFHSVSLNRAVLWFVVFGLVLALIWVRLEVLLIALAEASIGAILTGVLINRALVATLPSKPPTSSTTSTSTGPAPKSLLRALSGSIVLLLLLASVIVVSRDPSGTWSQLISERSLWFASIAVVVITLASFTYLRQAHLIKRLFALNLLAAGVFLFMISMAQYLREPSPASQALVLAGMLVSLAATSLALYLFRRYHADSQRVSLAEEQP